MQANHAGATPIDLAQKRSSGESLNALLLACSGSTAPEALKAIRILTSNGAVPDTWAPNGQSSLMCAAASDSPAAIDLLLQAGASLELQDAMGRTALMWAAGSGSVAALNALLNGGASLAQRDRRGRIAADYAADFPAVKSALDKRVDELETKSAAAQEALLAELCAENERKAATKANKKAKKKAAKDKKRAVTEHETVIVDNDISDAIKERAIAISDEERVTTSSVPSSPRQELTTDGDIQVCTPRSSNADEDTKPESPEWSTVTVKVTKKASSQDNQGIRPTTGSAATHRRSPSVTSASSIASHDTDGSKHCGSERSVLKIWGSGSKPSSIVANNLARNPTLPGNGLAPQQTSRSTTVGDDVVLSAGSFTAVASSGGMTLPEVLTPREAPCVRSASSWASIAAQGTRKCTGVNPVGWKDQSQSTDGMKDLVTTSIPSDRTEQPALRPAHNSPVPQRQLADVEEIEKLRREIQQLRLQAASAELAHQQELADVLQDAARHEAAAIAAAVEEERMGCVVRFASLLQNNSIALASVMPSLLAGAAGQSLQNTDTLSTFMSNNNNGYSNYGFDDFDGDKRLQAGKHLGLERTTERVPMNLYETQAACNFTASTRMISSPMAPSRTKASPTSSASCDLFGVGNNPLSTSPFSFEVGEGLRAEYLDNHSAFLVPANEPDTHLLGQNLVNSMQRKSFGHDAKQRSYDNSFGLE